MAKTGYLIVVYQDVNPSSPTYNQTREERTQDEENCPSSAAAHWIEDTRYCELTEGGMNTGYEITVYRDVEPLSATYNQTREERELNPTECEADETAPNWRNIGEPFCRQIVYLPGGLLGNDGYMVQQQQDMNEYSPTADEIRAVETLDLENCPIPDTQPVWQNISESCHLVMYGGQLVYDGTKDVTRVNTNRYSPSWNSNIPETVNIEDETNCPSAIEVQYRWVVVTGEYICVGYDKHSMEKKQLSRDGGTTWTDVTPLETRAGALIEANSEDCGYVPTIEYRWVTVSGQYECVGYDKYSVEKKQQSVDGGEWTDVVPSETRTGSVIEYNSSDCGYIEPQYRWVVVTGQYECVGYDKYSVEKKQQSTDGGSTWTDVVPAETRTGSVIEYNSEDCGYVPPTPIDYSREYLTFEVVESGTISMKASYSNVAKTISYSLDNGNTWTELTTSTSEQQLGGTLNVGDKVLVKGTNSSYADGPGYYNSFGGTAKTNVYGNIMSLIYGDNFVGQTTLSESYTFFQLFSNNVNLLSAENLVLPATTLAGSCYSDMFKGCTRLTTAPALPATTLADGCYIGMFSGCTNLVTAPELSATNLSISCYDSMFSGCTSLTTAPALPATTLAQSCYSNMFYNCRSLTTAPALPATTLTNNCYSNMFNGCTSLTTAPALPATTLANYCYQYMFNYCTRLTAAPALPATTLANYCYQYMFRECYSLTQAPALPATTLAENCYGYMFQNCTRLVNAPELTATTLADWCYQSMFNGCSGLTTAPELPSTNLSIRCYSNMFQGCTSLTSAPELPATTLALSCYFGMFIGCTSLTSAPELPATTLVNGCYSQMFQNCTSLNYIKAMFTTTPSTSYTQNWVRNVASTGTFVKNSAATWTTTGANGIPSGWTVISQ